MAAPRVRVEQARVLLDQAVLATAPAPGKLERIEPLFYELKSRRERADELLPYELEVADDVDGYRFKSAFQTAAFSGWTTAAVRTGERPVVLHALVPARPGESSPSLLREQHLVFVARRDRIELWRAAPGADSESEVAETAAKSEDAKVGDARGAAMSEQLRSLLSAECASERGCSPALLLVAGDAPFSMTRVVIEALAEATAPSKRAAALQLAAREPGAPGVPPDARMIATTAKGRLPPELIQRTVRQNYTTFRKCFEQGLARDPKLSGRISVRFVIDRDGRVSSAAAEATGTYLKDQAVVSCVVEGFKSITFRKPEGGIVTVVYPIMFEPG